MTRAPFTPLDWVTWAAEMGAQGAALVTALRLPRRDRPHAALFVFVLVAEVWMRATQELLFVGAPPQLPPSLRALYHVETLLVTAWPAAVAALAWWCFCGPQKANGSINTSRSSDQGGFRPPHRVSRERAHVTVVVKTIGIAWLSFNVAMVAAFPLPRGWTQPALHTFQGACVLAAGAAIVLGWERRRERAATVAFHLAGLELLIATVGPYARNVFQDWRTTGAAGYALGFALLAHLQWRWRRADSGV